MTDHGTSPAADRSIHILISSTFRDMHAERERLRSAAGVRTVATPFTTAGVGQPCHLLAERTGLDQATISRIERGRGGIDYDVLDRLCEALEFEPGEILVREPRCRRRPKGTGR